MKRIYLLIGILLITNLSFAASRKRFPAEKALGNKTWVVGSAAVVKVKGNPDSSHIKCDKFIVQAGKQISFDLVCGSSEESRVYQSAGSVGHTVSIKPGYTTITKYGYMERKPQVSQLEQTQLRVPFVEEILHIKKDKNGHLAFYFEKFKVDEFGRVVQSQLIQAYGLEAAKIEISSN